MNKEKQCKIFLLCNYYLDIYVCVYNLCTRNVNLYSKYMSFFLNENFS